MERREGGRELGRGKGGRVNQYCQGNENRASILRSLEANIIITAE